MPEFLLPDVGEGLTEAEIVAWKVKVGDVIAINDIVVEIETAKSLVELPSPYAGTVTALLVPEGETVAGRHADHRDRRPERGAGARAGRARSCRAGDGDRPVQPGRQRRRRGREPGRPQQGRPRRRSAAPARRATPGVAVGAAAASCRSRARSSPAPSPDGRGAPTSPRCPRRSSRRAASAVADRRARAGQAAGAQAGQGPRRRPRHADADRRRAAPSPVTTSSWPPRRRRSRHWLDRRRVGSSAVARRPGERERREPIKGVRKMMAGAMVQSAFTAPHVTEWITVDVTAHHGVRRPAQEAPRVQDVKVSPLLVLAAR